MNEPHDPDGTTPTPWVLLEEWHLEVLAFDSPSPAQVEAMRDAVRWGLAAPLKDLVSQHITVALSVGGPQLVT